ncbi:MAG: DUF1800 family protein [Bryobacteraceae bacterium]
MPYRLSIALFLCLTAASGVTTPVVAVNVYPETVTIRLGTPKTFSVSVSNTTNKAVTWFVNTTAGGNSTLGTIDAAGVYTPPAKVPAPNVVIVKAVSQADPAKSDTSTVTLQNPLPSLSSLVPPDFNAGKPFSIQVLGRNFVSGAVVRFGGSPLTTKFVSSNELRTTGTVAVAAGTKVKIDIVNPDPGSAASNAKEITVMAPVTVTVSPETRNLRGGATYDFYSSVANNSNRNVVWSVNGVNGGNAVLGTVDSQGIYQAPVILPDPPKVVLKATSVVDTQASDTAEVTLLNPLPVIAGLSTQGIAIGPTTFSINGSGFAKPAKVTLNGSAVTATWVSPTQLTVTATMPPCVGGFALIQVANPDPGAASSAAYAVRVRPAKVVMSQSTASRFLEQASWGPDPESLAKVMATGREAWINEQFAAPMSTYDDPVNEDEGLSSLQRDFFRNALRGKDQLRQRVAFALSQIFVVSGVDLRRYHQMVSFQRLMLQHAFGNFQNVLREVTLSPAMGDYLDMVNNDKPDLKRNILPNENYAREVLQLFTIGLFELNLNGTRRTDSAGQPVPAYSEDTVKQFTLAFTGWTYPPKPGFQSKWKNDRNYFGQMVPCNEHHDDTQKTLLSGLVLPPGRTAQEDLDAALANLFEHPNVAPFIATRLIQRLVAGNPSPEYVARVASVFNNSNGIRGDLKAVVRAILTDTEAGTPTALNAGAPDLGPTGGHLREPVLFATTLLRAMGVVITDEPSVAGHSETMGQKLFFPPSVFNYFSPAYRVQGITAPEFQILNPSTALARINFVHRAVNNYLGSTVQVQTKHFEGLGGSPDLLLEAIGNAFLRGQMKDDMKTSILKAIGTTTDPRMKARIALYLTATQSRFQVER